MANYERWPSGEDRQVIFTPAFHKCSDEPGKNYGIGSVKMLWVLRHEGWAMTWDVFTDWGLPDAAFKDAAPSCRHPSHAKGYPNHKGHGGAVDWHSPVPTYEGQDLAQSRCVWLDGPCYLDTGFCLGDDLFELLCKEGGEAVWAYLRVLLDQSRADVVAPRE